MRITQRGETEPKLNTSGEKIHINNVLIIANNKRYRVICDMFPWLYRIKSDQRHSVISWRSFNLYDVESR